MNALSIIILLAIPFLMLVAGELVKRLVIGRQAPERRRRPVAIPVREASAAEARATSDARVA